MPRSAKDQYGKQEAQERFKAALRGALNTAPKPLKSLTLKRARAKPKKAR
jgi:hypothetical protein